MPLILEVCPMQGVATSMRRHTTCNLVIYNIKSFGK
jgi:hypothetical protein